MSAWVFGPFRLDEDGLSRDGVALHVQPKALVALRLLVAGEGRVIAAEALSEALWPGVFVGKDALPQMIRRVRAALGDAQGWVEVVPKRGYRLTAPVQAAGSEAPMGLLGRGALWTALRAAAAEPGVTVLVGPGGIGKTSLARQLDGVFVSLTAATRAADVLLALGQALRVAVAGEDRATWTHHLGRALAAAPQPLVLDNAEQVGAELAALLTGLRRAAPAARLVVTSRTPLPLPDARHLAVGPLSERDGERLFRLRGGREADPGQVRALVEHLAGNPLAIELAAAREATVPVPELLRRLRHDLRALRRRGDAPHDDWARVLAGSWALLRDAEREALALAASLAGPVRVADLEAAFGDAALALVDTLTAHGLLSPDAPGTLRILPLVATFARQHREALPGYPARLDAFTRAVLERLGPALRSFAADPSTENAERFEPHLGDTLALVRAEPGAPAVAALAAAAAPVLVRWLDRESPTRDLLACADAASGEQAAIIVNALSSPMYTQGSVSEATARLAALLPRLPRGPLWRRTFAQHAHLAQLRTPEAQQALEDELDAALREGELLGAAYLLTAWSELTGLTGARGASEARLREALGWLVTPVTFPIRVSILERLGWACRYRGELAASLTFTEQAARLAAAYGTPIQRRSIQMSLANSLLQAGRLDEADRAYAALFEHAEASNQPQAIASVLGNRSLGWCFAGRFDEASAAAHRVRELAIEHENPRMRCWATYLLGGYAQHAGRPAVALRWFELGEADAQAAGLERFARLCALGAAANLGPLGRADEGWAALGRVALVDGEARALAALARATLEADSGRFEAELARALTEDGETQTMRFAVERARLNRALR